MKSAAEIVTETVRTLAEVVVTQLREELIGLLKALAQAGVVTITALGEAAQAWLQSKTQVTTVGDMRAVI